MSILLNETETVIYREQEIALAQINDLARSNASKRHADAIAAINASYEAEKLAADTAYNASVQSVISQIISNRL